MSEHGKEVTICTKCKHSRHLCLGIYKCMVSPRFDSYMDFTTGHKVSPRDIYDFMGCDAINKDGNCPKYEAETSKWKLFWK